MCSDFEMDIINLLHDQDACEGAECTFASSQLTDHFDGEVQQVNVEILGSYEQEDNQPAELLFLNQRDADMEMDDISFMGRNDDGYIPDGKITIERTISGLRESFDLYRKNCGLYIHEGGRWIRVDGSGTFDLHNIKYNKV